MYKKIDSFEAIRELFNELFGDGPKAVIVYCRDDQIFAELELLKDGSISIHLDRDADNVVIGDTIEVVIHDKEISYSFETRVQDTDGDIFGVSYPEFMLGFKKKNESLQQTAADMLSLKFDFSEKNFKAESVGITGLTLTSEEELPIDGRTLRDCCMTISKERSYYFDARAKLVSKEPCTYRLHFIHLDQTLADELLKIAIRLKYQGLFPLGSYRIESVFQLFNGAECFEEYADKDLSFIKEKFDKTYSLLRDMEVKHEYMYSFGYSKDNLLHAGITAIRLFKESYFTKYYASVEKEAFRKVPKNQIRNALLYAQAGDASFSYQYSYIFDRNAFQELDFVNACKKHQDNLNIGVKEENFLKFYADEAVQASKISGLYCEIEDDAGSFLKTAQSVLTPIEKSVFAYSNEDFFLCKNSHHVVSSDLPVKRRLFKVYDDETVLCHAVVEIYEETLKDQCLYEVVRIYPTAAVKEMHKVVDCLLPEALKFFKLFGRNNIYVSYPASYSPENPLAASSEKVTCVMLSREGANIINKFV